MAVPYSKKFVVKCNVGRHGVRSHVCSKGMDTTRKRDVRTVYGNYAVPRNVKLNTHVYASRCSCVGTRPCRVYTTQILAHRQAAFIQPCMHACVHASVTPPCLIARLHFQRSPSVNPPALRLELFLSRAACCLADDTIITNEIGTPDPN